MLRNAQPVVGSHDLAGLPLIAGDREGILLVDAHTGMPRRVVMP